jgi:S-adenosylmethionine synthetase
MGIAPTIRGSRVFEAVHRDRVDAFLSVCISRVSPKMALHLTTRGSVMSTQSLFTSESVSIGHPDKVADQISDAVLDFCLKADPRSRVACETAVTTDLAILCGEITTGANLTTDTVRRLAYDTLVEIGYTDPAMLFSAETCNIFNFLHKQSPDIAMGVDTGGAGDQGLMFGFACDETRDLMPLPIHVAHRLVARQVELRRSGRLPWLRPDAKSQVTVVYDDAGKPVRFDTVVLSTQHDERVMGLKDGKDYFTDEARQQLIDQLIAPTLRAERDDLVQGELVLMTPDNLQASVPEGAIRCFVNPTGCFLIGGPHGDAGLTGRKIIVDTYGGYARHGGGAFSGKDPTKVDRSAAYIARYLAKQVVAAQLAAKCEIQLAYAIGVPEPVSVRVDTFGTGKTADTAIAAKLLSLFDLRPAGIIEKLDLRRPIYAPTARNGHFGNPAFPWEATDSAGQLA